MPCKFAHFFLWTALSRSGNSGMIECLGLEGLSIVSHPKSELAVSLHFWQLCFALLLDSFQCYLFFALISFCFRVLARLVLESDFFGRIKIRWETTNCYLCLNKKGKLVTRVRIVLRKILTWGEVSLDVNSFVLFPWTLEPVRIVIFRRFSCVTPYTKRKKTPR